MRAVDIIERPDADELAAITAVVECEARRRGEHPLSDHLRLDLAAGGGPGFVAVRVRASDRTLAVVQISAANDNAALEVVLAEGADAMVRDDAVETAVDAFRRRGGGRLVWWLDRPDDHDRAVARRLGLEPWRELHEMRRPLPVGRRSSIETRSFEPGLDELAFLEVNNRAFAGHGEQGGWTPATLRSRMDQSWFDPDGFRLHDRDGRLAGFCWTKVHTDHDPVMGEIYVIAVDPDFHGLGLGRELTLAGLDSISDRGISLANLYVDGTNAPAVGLYDELGFAVHRTRVAFAANFDPPSEET